MFAKAQSSLRKDIERAFEVIVVRFQKDMVFASKVCIIMRIMIVEDRRDKHESGFSSLQCFEDIRSMCGCCEGFVWESEHYTVALMGQNMTRGM